MRQFVINIDIIYDVWSDHLERKAEQKIYVSHRKSRRVRESSHVSPIFNEPDQIY